MQLHVEVSYNTIGSLLLKLNNTFHILSEKAVCMKIYEKWQSKVIIRDITLTSIHVSSNLWKKHKFLWNPFRNDRQDAFHEEIYKAISKCVTSLKINISSTKQILLWTLVSQQINLNQNTSRDEGEEATDIQTDWRRATNDGISSSGLCFTLWQHKCNGDA